MPMATWALPLRVFAQGLLHTEPDRNSETTGIPVMSSTHSVTREEGSIETVVLRTSGRGIPKQE